MTEAAPQFSGPDFDPKAAIFRIMVRGPKGLDPAPLSKDETVPVVEPSTLTNQMEE